MEGSVFHIILCFDGCSDIFWGEFWTWGRQPWCNWIFLQNVFHYPRDYDLYLLLSM